MKLATIRTDRQDGQLAVVSKDGRRAVAATGVADTLQQALEHWTSVEPALRELAERLNSEEITGTPFDIKACDAPLPRAWQWLDGSAFENHGALMQKAFDLPPIETDVPLMYQGVSDHFYSGDDDVILPSEADGIDFEGELCNRRSHPHGHPS